MEGFRIAVRGDDIRIPEKVILSADIWKGSYEKGMDLHCIDNDTGAKAIMSLDTRELVKLKAAIEMALK